MRFYKRLALSSMAAAAIAGPSAAVMATAADAATHTFPAKVDINGRANIGDAADAPGSKPDAYKAGQDVPVECQQQHDGEIWDKTADNLWVPDKFVKTGTDGFADGVDRCDGNTPQPPTAPGNVIHPTVTAYTWHDNDPPGPEISHGTIHRNGAGGVGTFEDPITVAVASRNGSLDYKPGTKMYIPSLKVYGVVEDTCGACGKVPKGQKIDIWIDGRDSSKAASNRCAESMTREREVEINPAPGKEVDSRPLFSGSHCRG